MYIKDFDKWNKVKRRVDALKPRPYISIGEIRWIAFGVNIGSEIDGKGDSFTRPGLILHVIGARLALIVPISSKLKALDGYVPIEFQNKTHSLCIHQIRIVSQNRIFSRKAKISQNRLEIIKETIKAFYNL